MTHSHTHSGLLITFEGGDGAGKTTLIKRVAEALKEEGQEVVVTREPGGCELGEMIRTLLLKVDPANSQLSNDAELALFMAARAQHIKEVILPALEKGEVVLCDRFHHSSIAYQGAGRGIGTDKVREVCRLLCKDLWPDVTFFLDLEPEVGRQRKQLDKTSAEFTQSDRIESETEAFHRRVRSAFQKMAIEEKDLFRIVDATGSPEMVFEAIYPHIQETLKTHTCS